MKSNLIIILLFFISNLLLADCSSCYEYRKITIITNDDKKYSSQIAINDHQFYLYKNMSKRNLTLQKYLKNEYGNKIKLNDNLILIKKSDLKINPGYYKYFLLRDIRKDKYISTNNIKSIKIANKSDYPIIRGEANEVTYNNDNHPLLNKRIPTQTFILESDAITLYYFLNYGDRHTNFKNKILEHINLKNGVSLVTSSDVYPSLKHAIDALHNINILFIEESSH